MGDESQSRDTLLRLSVPEAASHLGVTQSAIRKRVQRKQIPFDKDERGYTYVYVSHDESQSRDRDGETVTEEDVTGLDPDESRNGASDDLQARVESLEKQVSFLQDELIARREEARRKDTILMQMSKALPEAREPTVNDFDDAGRGDISPEPEKRSFWQKLFGM